MDRLSSIMLRLSLAWLLVGIVLGALMLTDEHIPGDWTLWFAPTHGHILFVGWFLQFALGVAYWLLPRKRSPRRPLGYNERVADAAVAALNLGLLLRVAGEPAQRAGWTGAWIFPALATSAALQVVAIATFAVQLWPRVAPRPLRGAASGTKTAAGEHANDGGS